MDRYYNNDIIQTKPTVQYPKVIRYRSSTIYPDIPLSEDDIYTYTILDGTNRFKIHFIQFS